MEKKATPPLVPGIIVSLILIVLSIVIYFSGLYTQTWSQYLGFAILVAGIIWAIINHAKEKVNQVTYGNLFGFGFKVAAIITCFMILYTVLAGFIFPDMKQKIIDIAREKATQRPGVTEEQVDQGMQFFEKNYTLLLVIGIVFWYLLIGVVSSLIGAAIPKKNPPAPFEFENKA
ncbi:MAG TPA: DUF4199 domain-containing protein [Puia sp.]|nr:DUF4199 domain-containing protein [Puia sp.]